MKKIEASELNQNFIELISRDWMLISAGDKEKFNTMTASWGYFGFFGNKPSVTILVRPERYTYQFIESKDCFTLSFFSSQYKDALTILGKKSGRDGDKITETGLTPSFTENGNPTFKEARIVMECKKVYGADMCGEGFVDQSMVETWYNPKKGNFHKMYIGEIINMWIEQ